MGVDAAGNLYVADCGARTLTRFAPDGSATVLLDQDRFAGFLPGRLEVTAGGHVLVEDDGHQLVTLVAPDGSTSVLPGSEDRYVASLALAADGTTWTTGGDGRLARFDPDGSVALLTASLEESGDPSYVETVGVLDDGRLALATDQGGVIYLVAPEDLADGTTAPERVRPTWELARRTTRDGSRVWVTVRVSLGGDEPVPTGTVTVDVYGRSRGPVALVDGEAVVRMRGPRAPGRYAATASYSGDDAYLPEDRTFSVRVRA